MHILKFFIYLLIILANSLAFSSEDAKRRVEYRAQCKDIVFNKSTLIVNSYESKPYQYNYINKKGEPQTSGLDIELINIIASKAGVDLKYKDSNWEEVLANIRDGKADVTSEVTYSDERAIFGKFSLPYRFEEISLFTNKNSRKILHFRNTDEFLAQIRLLNFKLGIATKTIYGDAMITDYLNSPLNNDIIFKYSNSDDMLVAFLNGRIDGFLSDKVAGVALTTGRALEIKQIPTGIRTPLHFIFSKKTVSSDIVENFNKGIRELVDSPKYKEIVKNYLYHVLLPKSISSEWCYLIGIIGAISFAISGIAIGANKNSSLFGTFLLASLPSILGCISFDITVNSDLTKPMDITPTYMEYIAIVVLFGFSILKLLYYYNKSLYDDHFVKRLSSMIILVCDALGQACFIITGVVLAIVARIEPFEFWGASLACVTSSVGLLLRNIIFNFEEESNSIPRGVNFEISILWSIIFIMLLDMHAYDPDYYTIKYSIIAIVSGAFISKLIIYYNNIPNLTFSPEVREIYLAGKPVDKSK